MECEAILPLLQYGIIYWLLTLISLYHHIAAIKIHVVCEEQISVAPKEVLEEC
jgi:hypothetical protein